MMPTPFPPPPEGSNEDDELWGLFVRLMLKWETEKARRRALEFAEQETERLRLLYVEALTRKGFIPQTA